MGISSTFKGGLFRRIRATRPPNIHRQCANFERSHPPSCNIGVTCSHASSVTQYCHIHYNKYIVSTVPRGTLRQLANVPRGATFLKVDGRPARLADGRERVARAFLLLDPLLLIPDDVKQQRLVLRARQALGGVLLVGAIVERLAGLASGTASLPSVRCCD